MYLHMHQGLGETTSVSISLPQSVAEAIELVEKAWGLARASPPDLAGALAIVSAAQRFLYPLQRGSWDRLSRQFRGVVDNASLQAYNLIVSEALGALNSLYIKLKLGVAPGGWWNYTISTLKSARFFLEWLADEGVSLELSDAPSYRHSFVTIESKKMGLSKGQLRVLMWLRRHSRKIAIAERGCGVDRRAIAGAIAWEALESPRFITVLSVGPGKMHVKTSLGSENVLAKQVEDAGYLKKVRYAERVKLLSTPGGAIMYIAASMKAAADIAWQVHGSDIYRDPGILTWFYNTSDLEEWQEHLKSKNARGERKFDVTKNPMARWVSSHIKFLELAVGKPNFNSRHPSGVPTPCLFT